MGVPLWLGVLLVAAAWWADGSAAAMTLTALVVALKIRDFMAWRARIDKVGGPESTFLAGSAKAMGKADTPERLQKFRELVARFPKAFRVWNGPMAVVQLVHPENVKPILSSPQTTKPPVLIKLWEHLSEGVLGANGWWWKQGRQILMPALHSTVMREYVPEWTEVIKGVLEELPMRFDGRGSVTVEMTDELSALITHATLESVFSCRGLKATDPFVTEYFMAAKTADVLMAHRSMRPLHVLLPNFLYVKTADGAKYAEACAKLNRLSQGMIDERRARIAEGGAEAYFDAKKASGERLDLLDRLLAARYADGGEISDRHIRGQCITFVVASFGTTSMAVSTTLFELAQRPELQRKCADEALTALAAGPLNLAAIKRLKLIGMCFKEALRKHPSVPVIVRPLEEPMEINGTVVDAGTMVAVNIYALHHNPTVWPDPEKYDPERFNPNREDKVDPYAWLPYSAGPRNCAGQTYADALGKLIIAEILSSWEVSLPDGADPPQFVNQILLMSLNGIHLKLSPRES